MLLLQRLVIDLAEIAKPATSRNIDLDGALGLVEDDGQVFEREMEFEDAELEDTTDDA
jgi:hypothetical protein